MIKNLSKTIIPNIFNDNRGSFSRIFCKKKFLNKTNVNIKQINLVKVKKCGTIKGFHLQKGKFKEDKYVICLKGKIIDYFFYIKKNKKIKIKNKQLSEKKLEILYIPKDYAHGFQTLTNNVILLYFHTNYYSKKNELGINPLDKQLKINWPIKKKIISKKDKNSKKIDELFKL